MKSLVCAAALLLLASCGDTTSDTGSISSIDSAKHQMSIWIGHVEYPVVGDESGDKFENYRIGDVVMFDCRHSYGSDEHRPFITGHHTAPYRDPVAYAQDGIAYIQIGDSLYTLNKATNVKRDPSTLKIGDTVTYVCQHNNLENSHYLLLTDAE